MCILFVFITYVYHNVRLKNLILNNGLCAYNIAFSLRVTVLLKELFSFMNEACLSQLTINRPEQPKCSHAFDVATPSN
jgi:hypothetical protein